MEAAAATQTMGKEDFLRLFTSQLKYQDPMNPMDSTAFTAQLAQFSSLEQLTNINSGMEELLSLQETMGNSMVTGFIGKTVTTEDGVTARVTGVSFESGTPSLMLENNTNCTISEILKISESNA